MSDQLTTKILKDIVDQTSGLETLSHRCVSDNYDERIIFNKDIEQWTKALASVLGLPIKPEGVNPTKDDLALTKKFGSVFKHQVLFKKEFSDSVIIAMFWPWLDKKHTTLKIARIYK